MTKILVLSSVLMSVLLLYAGTFASSAFAKPSDSMSAEEKKKFVQNAKSLAEQTRKKALEKIHDDYKSKKDDSKKQIALEAKKKLDSIKKNKK